MAEKLGNEMKLYVGEVDGAIGTTLVAKVREHDLGLKAGEVDKTSRASAGWKDYRQGNKEWAPSFDMLYDPAANAWEMIMAAFHTGSRIGCSILDGELGVGDGLQGTVVVIDVSQGEPLEGMATNKVQFKGCGAPTRVM